MSVAFHALRSTVQMPFQTPFNTVFDNYGAGPSKLFLILRVGPPPATPTGLWHVARLSGGTRSGCGERVLQAGLAGAPGRNLLAFP